MFQREFLTIIVRFHDRQILLFEYFAVSRQTNLCATDFSSKMPTMSELSQFPLLIVLAVTCTLVTTAGQALLVFVWIALVGALLRTLVCSQKYRATFGHSTLER
jgi:hypothetical protein